MTRALHIVRSVTGNYRCCHVHSCSSCGYRHFSSDSSRAGSVACFSSYAPLPVVFPVSASLSNCIIYPALISRFIPISDQGSAPDLCWLRL